MSNPDDIPPAGGLSKGAATRARLLEIAVAQFATHGYHATKVSDIVRAAGVTQPAFYLYFTSKEAIFAEVIEHFRGELQAWIRKAPVQPVKDSTELALQMRAQLEAIYGCFAARPQQTAVALLQNPDVDVIRTDLITVMYHQLLQGHQAGILRDHASLEVVSVAQVGMLERLTEFWLLTGDRTAGELAEAHAELILLGVLARR